MSEAMTAMKSAVERAAKGIRARWQAVEYVAE